MIRAASVDDIESLIQLIHDLAAYERSPEAVEIDPEQLRRALFGPSPTVFAHVAEADGRIQGMAIWFLNFSTWTGQHGIYLEDLYVRPDQRRSGLGRDLLAELAKRAHSQEIVTHPDQFRGIAPAASRRAQVIPLGHQRPAPQVLTRQLSEYDQLCGVEVLPCNLN